MTSMDPNADAIKARMADLLSIIRRCKRNERMALNEYLELDTKLAEINKAKVDEDKKPE